MENYGGSTSVAAAQASDQAQRTADAAAEALDGAKRTARAAIDAGRGYASDFVDAATKKIKAGKGHIDRVSEQTSRYVID